MSSSLQGSAPRAPLTIFSARRIITMGESLPKATAVGVVGGRIVAVGDLASMAPGLERHRYRALAAVCCGFTDRCDIVRQWSAWLCAAWPQTRSA